MNPHIDRYLSELTERQDRRNTLHLNFGSAMKSPRRRPERESETANRFGETR